MILQMKAYVCGLKQSPTNPAYNHQAKKRGLNCSNGNLVGKTNPSIE